MYWKHLKGEIKLAECQFDEKLLFHITFAEIEN
jgi:hypothetical protein